MAATLIERSETKVTIQIEVTLTKSMLQTEEAILEAVNEAGALATGAALEGFDTDGSALDIGSTRYTSKGRLPKTYQTPYGDSVVQRHVYQSSEGGTTFCPLEQQARIIHTATPFFAKQVSSKYSEMAGGRVVADLDGNHRRFVSLCLVQDLANAVAQLARCKEEQWQYAPPEMDKPVATIGLGVDGTCLLLLEDGNRQAMVGTISLYDKDGERLHTIYLAAQPQYGKEAFFARMDKEIRRTQLLYPQAHVTGIADGARDNWTFLSRHANDQCLDFWHAAGYLSKAALAACPRKKSQQKQWSEDRCHRLKHHEGAALAILEELKQISTKGVGRSAKEDLKEAITYFTNHMHKMDYAQRAARGWPIGSGVTESACKTLVKMRLCRSGAKWSEPGAGHVLALRALHYTSGRWSQFWAKIDQYGVPVDL